MSVFELETGVSAKPGGVALNRRASEEALGLASAMATLSSSTNTERPLLDDLVALACLAEVRRERSSKSSSVSKIPIAAAEPAFQASPSPRAASPVMGSPIEGDSGPSATPARAALGTNAGNTSVSNRAGAVISPSTILPESPLSVLHPVAKKGSPGLSPNSSPTNSASPGSVKRSPPNKSPTSTSKSVTSTGTMEMAAASSTDKLPSPTSSGRKSPTQLAPVVHTHAPVPNTLPTASPTAGGTHTLDRLLQVDTRSGVGRAGSLAPLNTTAVSHTGGTSKRSPGSSPLGAGAAASPSSSIKLDESVESISESIASLTSSIDQNSPQAARPAGAGLSAVTTHSTGPIARPALDPTAHGRTQVVEVQSKGDKKPAADVVVGRGAGGSVSRSKLGWDAPRSHNDDDVFAETDSVGGYDLEDSSTPSSPTTHPSEHASIQGHSNSAREILEESIDSLPLSPAAKGTFARSPDAPVPVLASVVSKSVAANQQHSSSSSSNNSLDAGESLSVDEYYADEGFEDDDDKSDEKPSKGKQDTIFEPASQYKGSSSAFAKTGGGKPQWGTARPMETRSADSSGILDATFESDNGTDSVPLPSKTKAASQFKATQSNKASDAIVLDDIEDSSVASEDLDALNASQSRGGQSMSDSFASLMNDSMNSQGMGNMSGKPAKPPKPAAQTSTEHSFVTKTTINGPGPEKPPRRGKSKEVDSTLHSSTASLGLEESRDQMSRSYASEGLDFSVQDIEVSSGSAGALAGYDFTTAALPPLKDQKRQHGGAAPKSGW